MLHVLRWCCWFEGSVDLVLMFMLVLILRWCLSFNVVGVFTCLYVLVGINSQLFVDSALDLLELELAPEYHGQQHFFCDV